LRFMSNLVRSPHVILNFFVGSGLGRVGREANPEIS